MKSSNRKQKQYYKSTTKQKSHKNKIVNTNNHPTILDIYDQLNNTVIFESLRKGQYITYQQIQDWLPTLQRNTPLHFVNWYPKHGFITYATIINQAYKNQYLK